MFGKSHKFSTLRGASLSSNNRARAIFGSGDIGDSIDDAENIGKLSRSSNYRNDGDVGGSDRDFYRFRVKKAGTVKLKFNNEDNGDPIEVSIVSRRNRTIAVDGRRLFTEVDSDRKGKLNARLGTGTYYLKIESEDGSNEDYSFTLKFKPSNNDDDDNDDDD